MAFIAPSSNMYDVYNSVQGLNRAAWNDYYSNYQGRMNDAYQQAFDTDFVANEKQRVGDAYDKAGVAALGMTNDMMARYGQEQSVDQKASTRAQTQLGLEGQKIGALNDTNYEAYQMQQGLRDSLIGEKFNEMSDAVGTANRVGQEAQQRMADYQKYKSQKRKNKLGALGAIAGLALAPFTGGASLALTGGSLGSMG